MTRPLFAILAAAALLVACGPPPQEVCAHGEKVYRPLSDPPACPVVDKVAAAGEQVCALALDGSSNVTVTLEPGHFDCGGRLVHGCQDGRELRIESNALIPDEYGHLIWERCYGRSGEHTNAQGKVEYDSDFSAWLEHIK